MSCEPSKWCNPADVMKRRKLKKKSKSISGEYPPKTGTVSHIVNKGISTKRANPFSCNSVNKRRAVINSETGLVENSVFDSLISTQPDKHTNDNEEEIRSYSQPNPIVVGTGSTAKLFRTLDIEEEDKEDSNTTPILSRSVSVFQNKGRQFQERFSNCIQTPDDKSTHEKLEDLPQISKESCTIKERLDLLPVDWSLKGKLRVTSEESLAWCVHMKSTDQAGGLQHFVGCKEQWSQDNSESSFHRCSLYWQHPNLPWTKLFPRIVSENKISRANIIGNSDDIKKCLYTDWSDSFTSAFHQLRSNYSPYFYMCTHQFTALFRGVGVAGINSISALLTPTTRGFREALKTEGIEFKMPLLEKKKSSLEDEDTELETTNTENTKPCGSIDDEDALDTDEGASVWLESLGLDKKQFPSLDPNKVKIQKEGYKRVDNRPESMIYVEGGEVQALFNFLLNCRTCIANSGEQAGIPPTILSPCPFTGATLKSNKVKHSHAKQTDSQGNSHRSHILEISGPLLPHNILNISSLFRQKIGREFSFTFNNHEPTAPFNIKISQNVEKDNNLFQNMNLRSDVRDSLYDGQTLERDVCCIKTINGSKDGFQVTV
ncbi:protein downstream neighbor of Son [Patella vulgata]|uniref:protein downstream neighbor of Son n=1 Tax=Patella vulgata TaxID=6465 RepID=UPI0021806AB9|nr:protein downstream neighbor of Son [Patella vulgata]